MTMTLITGLLIPLLGTMLGSAFVFFMKDEMSVRVQKTLLGFASRVMVAASVSPPHVSIFSVPRRALRHFARLRPRSHLRTVVHRRAHRMGVQSSGKYLWHQSRPA